MFDIERLAGRQIDDPLGQLRRAGFHVRAAYIFVSLFGGSEFRAAARATRGHHEPAELALASLASLQHRTDKLGNHVSRLAHHHGVADEHAFAFHFKGVVQRGTGYCGTGHVHGLQHRHRSHTSGAPHLHSDVKQLGIDFFRWIFVGDGPARRTRCGAKGTLQSQIVDLHDDAVKRVFDVASVFAVIVDHVEDFLERRDLTVVRRDGHTPFLIQFVGFGLVVDHIMAVAGVPRTPTQRSDAVRVEAQATGCGDTRILLSQATCGRVAGIGEWRATGVLVLGVQLVEIVPSHEHFAADLHEFGNVFLRSGKVLRNGGDGAHVESDVLAGHAIASGQTLFKHAVAVDEVQRKTVDFHLAGHGQWLRFGPIQSPEHAVVPFAQLLDGEHVIEAHHARWMTYGSEVVGERAAHTMGR